ncbi:MAG TPA: histidine kinase [Alphaproteobacteria bacterium]|nr:histidine kinase [Alphaproteobacteria bacterium]
MTTHLLYLLIRRLRWMHLSGGKLVVRLLVSVTMASAFAVAVIAVGGRALLDSMYHIDDVRRFIVNWITWMILLTAWTSLYATIYEFQQRRERELRSLRLETMVQQAQLRGLRAQLNPHFLFNCLNDLREVIEENQERAQLMVTQLSALLRYSLQANQSELAPLADEIQAVKDYLALEKIRFEERLQVEWSVDEATAGIRVPPMLLQTLVENALKHGIARRTEGGHVAIQTRVSGPDLLLEVINSGKLEPEPSSNSLGLKNAQELLKLLYGDRASLILESVAPDSVHALVRIPVARSGVKA